MNSKSNDPILPTLAQMEKAYGISLTSLEKRMSIVSTSNTNKVPLNDNDMDHNSEYVQPSKRHTAKISVKHNLNDSVVSENKYDNLSVDHNEVEQGVIIPV
ncbi:hypothetical protein AVEN_20259-1 [Araneus ventricosus]|uniref:Uncharacterized protein n=1 Tax=Araneus ventricosus TaxID=182803 RepID=A0A4Y2JKY5_ARAVE|nr:hypothetical protein AVEN_20259-1 [Araneus ventricosus]